MTLTMILLGLLVILGAWALLFTSHFLNVRQTQGTVILVARVLYIICVVILILVLIGAIPDKLVSS